MHAGLKRHRVILGLAASSEGGVRLLVSIRSAARLRGFFKNVSVSAPSASSALILS
jgi:hypothetical protein